MKVTTHGDNLFQLTQLVAFNCYLVREDDGFTLIDTSNSGQAPSIMQAAEQLGQPIARILLTHAHVDHVGSLDALHEALPDVPVAISERDARFLTGDKSLDPSNHRPSCAAAIRSAQQNRSFYCTKETASARSK